MHSIMGFGDADNCIGRSSYATQIFNCETGHVTLSIALQNRLLDSDITRLDIGVIRTVVLYDVSLHRIYSNRVSDNLEVV